jgi:integrase
MPPATTTIQTVTRYKKRATSLELRARNDLGLAPAAILDAIEFVSWAIALRPALSQSTWRQYKASIRCALTLQGTQKNRQALAILEGANATPCKRVTRNTSAQKVRYLKPDDYKAIRDSLLSTGGKWARPTAVWLAAATITGLRPAEWPGTQLVEGTGGTRTLLVPNAKTTNGRGNGASRSLDLRDLERGLLAILKRHLVFVAEHSSQKAFNRAYNSCRKALYHATRTIWPKREMHVSFYSARHQFSADAKASGISLAEIAALMGHASDATASLHYGRRTSGQSGFRIRATPSEVLMVRRTAVSRADRFALKAKRATATPSPRPTR